MSPLRQNKLSALFRKYKETDHHIQACTKQGSGAGAAAGAAVCAQW